MTDQYARNYLDSFVNYEQMPQPDALREAKPERVRALCERLGEPQHRFRSILVAGTNGKGSICAMLYAILSAAGLRAGLYTSPHLEDVRERIRVSMTGLSRDPQTGNGSADWISETDLSRLVREHWLNLEEFRDDCPYGPPTYFEVLTALALRYFAQRQVEVAVLEVGLGGRLDATNVVEQAVSVIGPIDLDHTEVLGADRLSVAREKLGIIKSPQTVVIAPQAPEVARLIDEMTTPRGCQSCVVGRELLSEIESHTPEGLRFSLQTTRGRYERLFLPLLGRHQADNAALAVAAVEQLSPTGCPYSAVATGLSQVAWPGRMEVIRRDPTVIFDGAHNPHAASALVAALRELWASSKPHYLLGVSSDKDVEAIATILGPSASSITCTSSGHPRALDPARLAESLQPHCPAVQVIPDAVDAYTFLLNAVKPNDLMVVTGSLFLVGRLRTALLHSQAQSLGGRPAQATEVVPCP